MCIVTYTEKEIVYETASINPEGSSEVCRSSVHPVKRSIPNRDKVNTRTVILPSKSQSEMVKEVPLWVDYKSVGSLPRSVSCVIDTVLQQILLLKLVSTCGFFPELILIVSKINKEST